MRVGVTFPQTELGGDPGAVRAYAERVEELGYSHILVYDHVLGADANVHRGWNGPYDVHTTFHEPFVMYGFLAAVTQALDDKWNHSADSRPIQWFGDSPIPAEQGQRVGIQRHHHHQSHEGRQGDREGEVDPQGMVFRQ